jgi:predicted ATPase
MSGTGESTALAGLALRGHTVVDTDDPGGWIVGTASVNGVEPMWDLDRIAAFTYIVTKSCGRAAGLGRVRPCGGWTCS